MDDCLALCGKIRQLTAGQQPIPPEISQYLQYFQDCILPPDGSWTYQAPVIRDEWGVTFTQRYAFLPSDAVVVSVPPWAWPFQWQDNAQIDEIKATGTNGPWPVQTVLVTLPGTGDYVITPDGQVQCSVPPPNGQPDPPDVDDPIPPEQPPDLTPRLDDLQQQVWAIKADLQQFKDTMFLSLDAIKQALWNTQIRSNFQAASVYASDFPGWVGPPPAAQQPALPPGWQTLPTPGNPQVLELPPIQEFPQAPAPQTLDLGPIEQRLNSVEQCCTTITTDFDNLLTELPGDIQQLIDQYDQNVEKPDLQKLRDECCQPQVVPGSPEPQDPCVEGQEKWGIMAECWHEANGQNPYPIDEDIAARPTPAETTLDFDQAVSQQPSGAFLERRVAADNAFLAAVKGQWTRPTNSYAPKLRTWVYQNPAPGTGV